MTILTDSGLRILVQGKCNRTECTLQEALFSLSLLIPLIFCMKGLSWGCEILHGALMTNNNKRMVKRNVRCGSVYISCMSQHNTVSAVKGKCKLENKKGVDSQSNSCSV